MFPTQYQKNLTCEDREYGKTMSNRSESFKRKDTSWQDAVAGICFSSSNNILYVCWGYKVGIPDFGCVRVANLFSS